VSSDPELGSTTHPSLPCHPCPHNASCCAYGTTLSDDEAAAIEAYLGPGLVHKRWGEWRTRIRDKRCVLYRDGGCAVHDQPFYPTVCRGFPWTDSEGSRYEYDVDICGEFTARPELVEIQRRGPPVRMTAGSAPSSADR
jgi:hypothetical protein